MGLFFSSLLFFHAVDTPGGQVLLSSFHTSLHLKEAVHSLPFTTHFSQS